MKVFKIMYDSTVVGLVVDESGSHTDDEALEAWNNANPSYQGESAESGPFITI